MTHWACMLHALPPVVSMQPCPSVCVHSSLQFSLPRPRYPSTAISFGTVLPSSSQVLGRKLYIRPLERNVEALRRRYPQLAAEADRALAAATSARSQRSNFVADAHTVPPGRQPPHALLRVDRLSAAFGRPEDLEDLEAGGGAGSNRKRKAAEGQPRAPPPGSPARPGPSAVVWDPALLRHLAPVQLSGSGWRLTGAEIALGCTPMPRGSAAEDQLFAELEALCCGVGSTGALCRCICAVPPCRAWQLTTTSKLLVAARGRPAPIPRRLPPRHVLQWSAAG